MPTFKISDRGHLKRLIPTLAQAVDKLFDNGRVAELLVRQESKTRDQEKKYHAMIRDLARVGVIEYGGQRVDFNAYKSRPETVAKTLLIVWYERDLREQGLALKNQPEHIICPVYGHPVQIRSSSAQFGVKEGANFIEFLYAVGAENRIAWSDPTEPNYDEYCNKG